MYIIIHTSRPSVKSDPVSSDRAIQSIKQIHSSQIYLSTIYPSVCRFIHSSHLFLYPRDPQFAILHLILQASLLYLSSSTLNSVLYLPTVPALPATPLSSYQRKPPYTWTLVLCTSRLLLQLRSTIHARVPPIAAICSILLGEYLCFCSLSRQTTRQVSGTIRFASLVQHSTCSYLSCLERLCA